MFYSSQKSSWVSNQINCSLLSAITHCKHCCELLMCFRWLCINDASESESVLLCTCDRSLGSSTTAIWDASGHPAATPEGQESAICPVSYLPARWDVWVSLGYLKGQQVPLLGQQPPPLHRGSAGQGTYFLGRHTARLKAAVCLWRVWTFCFLSLTTIINNFMISSFILNLYWLMKFLFLSFDVHSCYFLQTLWVSPHHYSTCHLICQLLHSNEWKTFTPNYNLWLDIPLSRSCRSLNSLTFFS